MTVKLEQISSSIFPELSDPWLTFEKVAPFPGQCQALGVRRRNPRKVWQKDIIPQNDKTLRRVELYHLKGSFLPRQDKEKTQKRMPGSRMAQEDLGPQHPSLSLYLGSGIHYPWDQSKSVSLRRIYHLHPEDHISLRSSLWGANEIIQTVAWTYRSHQLLG